MPGIQTQCWYFVVLLITQQVYTNDENIYVLGYTAKQVNGNQILLKCLN